MSANNIPAGYKLVSGNAYGQDYVSLVEPSGTILVHAYEQGAPGMFAFLTALAATPSTAATKCACGDRLATECDEEWGPKCDMGNNAAHVQVSTVDPAVIDAAIAATPASPQAPAPQAVVGEAMREFLGKLVRAEWVAWASEQANPKPSWLLPWADLTEPEREVDRRIGERLWRFSYVRDTAPGEQK